MVLPIIIDHRVVSHVNTSLRAASPNTKMGEAAFDQQEWSQLSFEQPCHAAYHFANICELQTQDGMPFELQAVYTK